MTIRSCTMQILSQVFACALPLAAQMLGSADGVAGHAIGFEVNRGQESSDVRFLSRHKDFTLLLTATGPVVRPHDEDAGVRIRFVGARSLPDVSGLELLPWRVHSFLGNDPRAWLTNIPAYGKVRYANLYPGIDVVFHGSRNELEYDFEIRPGADSGTIALRFEGAQGIRVDSAGDLIVRTASGELRQRRPRVFQESGARRVEKPGSYRIVGRRPAVTVAIAVAEYDPALPLVIDPVLTYSTYTGGGGADMGEAIAVDAAGNVYVAGSTSSANFPTARAVQPASRGGVGEAFIFKLNPAGNALVWATYLGGSGDDNIFGIAVDSAGAVYVTGNTASSNFPTVRAIQATNRSGTFFGVLGYDGFVTKLSPAGDAIVYSTYLGGSGVFDRGNEIAVDAAGNAYVTGRADSSNFPAVNSIQPFGGEIDAFVAKINPQGAALVYCTFLGGRDQDIGEGIAVDRSGAAYITGDTRSTDFPLVSPLQPQKGDRGNFFDWFAAKLNPAGTALVYSTFLGGSSNDQARAIAVDSAGNAVVTGFTTSGDFPTARAVQGSLANPPNSSNSDGVVAKLDASGAALVYSTYYGGPNSDTLLAVAVDSAGNAYVTGWARAQYPLVNPMQSTVSGAQDIVLTKFNPSGTPIYSTYLGGSGAELGRGVAADADGNAYVTGNTTSTDFATVSPVQGSNAGGADSFVLKVADTTGMQISAQGVVNAASFQGGEVTPGGIVTLFGAGIGPAAITGAALDGEGRVSTALAGTRILFDDVPAPLVYVSASQSSAIVPYAVAGRASTQLTVEYEGSRSNTVMLPVAVSRPALFTADSSGRGQAAALRADFSVNSAANPVPRGDIIVLFGTGEGQTDPPGVDGKLATDTLPKPQLPVTVQIGGLEAEVLYVGAAPGLVAGVFQANVRIPAGVTPGNAVPVIVRVGAAASPSGVTVAVSPL